VLLCREMAATDTRRRVLDAALKCFLQEGHEATTIARIRELSGVSNGALFHHFASKEAIASALYVEAISSFQAGLWELLAGKPRSLRAAVRGTIAHQLGWIQEHPDLASFVYMRGHLDWDTPAGAEVAALNRELAAAFRGRLEPFVNAGEVRPMSMTLITAIVAAPAHAIARRWLAGHLSGSPLDHLDDLADAAWAGLRGKPAPGRGAKAKAPRNACVNVELLDDDGSVLARGRACTTLEAAAVTA